MQKILARTVVVQGGTFYNDAVLRSFEKIAGCPSRTVRILPVLWERFGAALIARERHDRTGYQTSMLSIDEINALTFDTKSCKMSGAVPTTVFLTINRFYRQPSVYYRQPL